MNIGIVEDEAVWRGQIQAVIEKYCRDKNISSQISSYGSGKDFMKNPDTDLLFLDIELAEGEDGFGIAEQLMHSGSSYKVCFLTSHTELARFGYWVNAFRCWMAANIFVKGGSLKRQIEETAYGYDISDYESEASYRFLADSSNIESIENNEIYIKYPDQVFSDGTTVFSYYILEYSTDEINVY